MKELKGINIFPIILFICIVTLLSYLVISSHYGGGKCDNLEDRLKQELNLTYECDFNFNKCFCFKYEKIIDGVKKSNKDYEIFEIGD